ncbi:aminoacyl-tRNA hydrolase [Robiginitalea aurantiaca]|uniref:Peptidyl-tRNA hydrolase n=1 Tax=Robiginitalea aurantiaca TaxID=3056915 RepID=A0ABT7WBC0_9FLAO|nr:aminoacyl-tRNA hydrolase [Robiginitalea aurantiaca]MDM9630213.1 aminoacyl-tRNA hydrolase [Robiginitalea aurantiaca]
MKKYLIAGLGNIGSEYVGTRHNIGFQILDHLAQDASVDFEPDRLGEVARIKKKGRILICLKPSTYMNRSGKAVRYWMEKEKIPRENLLVVTDDLNLPFGTLRLKTKGSDGGHNGLKDIQTVLGHTSYCRFRFGIGSDFDRGRQVDYVLGTWSDTELETMPERLKRSTELIHSFVFAGTAITMNTFNGT